MLDSDNSTPEPATASDRSGGSLPSASGALNPPPAAPLDHTEGDDTGSPDSAQALPSATPTATQASNDDSDGSADDPDPTATKKPSSSTAANNASPTPPPPPTATKKPSSSTAANNASPTPPPPPTATATQPPPPPQSVSLHSMEAAMFDSHNVQRANNGRAPLVIDTELVEVARQRSQTMANTNCFSHTACGPTAFDLLGQIPYFYQIAGENIARNNYPDSQTVQVAMTGFMNSTGHRNNILDDRYTKVGIGVAFGANGMKYFTVIFAGP